MPSAPPAVLFVCLGNICRSPMAEGAFVSRAKAAGLDAIADSAGTGGWHVGSAPDRQAQAAALRHGVDISGQRGRKVRADDFARFGHVFALDRSVLADLRRIAPSRPGAHVGLLLDLVPGLEGQSVADPYGRSDAAFDTAWRQVDAAAAALVERLKG